MAQGATSAGEIERGFKGRRCVGSDGMATLLTRLCEEFAARVRPLVPPLDKAAASLDDTPKGSPGRALATQLLELRHQLTLVTDKVEEQQAYVLIFGPLKSGKSTLMNTLAATYVSEVSALPAYPCLVFVSHSPQRRFTVTLYDGAIERFDDTATLERRIEQAHEDLATRIRECEAGGATFDPQQHYPQAICRVDVGVPAPELAKTNAVLVDTPGLYSRMRFGYDRMTKDFRNTAASAIFVVRSDNLFLDHVFDEFERLLELFSRVFLIVNVDSNKLDLRPDGSLAPSLEQSDPGRVLAAFETFAMSAALKAALESGRLRCYPVDLMRAGSRRIRANAAHAADGLAPEDPPDAAAEDDGFDAFFGDLSSYLESPDYVQAFFGDSLRRATHLLDECRNVGRHPELEVVRRKLADSEQQLQVLREGVGAFERVESHDWEARAASLQEGIAPVLAKQAEAAAESLAREQDTVLRRWFRNDASLRELLKEEYVPKLVAYQEELTNNASKELSERVVQGHAGFALPADLVADLQTVGIPLSDIGRELHLRTDRAALIRVPPTPLRGEDLPVRRRLSDWLLLRRGPALPERVFGPREDPSRAIPAREKAARLGGKAEQELRRRLDASRSQLQRETADRVRRSFVADYSTAVVREVRRQVGQRRAQHDERIAKLENIAMRCRGILEPLEEMSQRIGTATEGLNQLSQRFGAMQATDLLAPATTNDPLIPAVPPVPKSAPDGVPKPTRS